MSNLLKWHWSSGACTAVTILLGADISEAMNMDQLWIIVFFFFSPSINLQSALKRVKANYLLSLRFNGGTSTFPSAPVSSFRGRIWSEIWLPVMWPLFIKRSSAFSDKPLSVLLSHLLCRELFSSAGLRIFCIPSCTIVSSGPLEPSALPHTLNDSFIFQFDSFGEGGGG